MSSQDLKVVVGLKILECVQVLKAEKEHSNFPGMMEQLVKIKHLFEIYKNAGGEPNAQLEDMLDTGIFAGAIVLQEDQGKYVSLANIFRLWGI